MNKKETILLKAFVRDMKHNLEQHEKHFLTTDGLTDRTTNYVKEIEVLVNEGVENYEMAYGKIKESET